MKRVIVTGATGMIACALIRKLVENNVEVIALCRKEDKKDDEFFKNKLVTAIDADISEYAQLSDKINEKCDVLYHFAWLGTFGNSRNDTYTQTDNIKYTLDALTLAHETGCECFVTAGSQAEYGRTTQKLTADTPANPETGYGVAKYTAAKFSRMYAEQLGIRYCHVRILSVFGQKGNPNSIIMSSLARMLNGEYTSYTKGEQQWDFLHCDDAALAFYLIGLKGKHGAVYPLGSGQTRQLADYITAMRDCVNSDLKLGIGDLPYNEGQVMYLCADISALTEDTGFVPQLSFEDGIYRTLEWMKGEMK